MLHFRQILRRTDDLPYALVVKLVGKGTRGTAAEHSANRNHMILFSHILMNRVVRESSQRESPASEKHLDLIRG